MSDLSEGERNATVFFVPSLFLCERRSAFLRTRAISGFGANRIEVSRDETGEACQRERSIVVPLLILPVLFIVVFGSKTVT